MQYNDVVNMVEGIANALGVQFFHGRNYDTTLEFGNAYPQIHLFPFQQTNVNENILRNDLLIGFFDIDGHENTMQQRQQIIANMWAVAAQFEQAARQVSGIQVISIVREPQYLQMMGVMSGVALRFVFNSGVGCGDPFVLCQPATIDLNGNSFLQVIAGGFANVRLIDLNGDTVTPISVVGSEITLPNSGGGGDATAVLRDSNNVVLSTTTIPCGTTENIPAPDATVLVNGDNSFPTIPSGGLENIGVENTNGAPVGAFDVNTNSWVVGDSVVTLRDSANNVLSVSNIAATDNDDILAPDATYNLDNSEGSTLFLGSILSGDNETIIAPDSTVTLNGGAFISVASGGSVDVTTVDQNNNTLTPTVTGSELKITLPQDTLIRFTFEAGQTDSVLYTIVNNVNNGSYTATSNDGGSGTITFSINGGAFAAFSSPLALAAGDTIQVRRTTATAQGFVQITGTY
jgi:hypothetical protein